MQTSTIHFIRFLLLLSFFVVSEIYAQPLFLKQKGDVFTNYPSTAIKKISFTNSDIVISTTNSLVNVPLTDFQYISFVNFETSIPAVKSKTNFMQLFPNIVDDFLTVKINTTTASGVSIQIRSIDGKLVGNFSMARGENNLKLHVSQLSKGIYMCYVLSSDLNEMAKFIKN